MAKYNTKNKGLFRLISLVKDEKEAQGLLEDLLAPNEIDSISERWAIMQEVAKGCSQRDIAGRLKISIAKVSRCAKVIKYGTGNIKLFLKRFNS